MSELASLRRAAARVEVLQNLIGMTRPDHSHARQLLEDQLAAVKADLRREHDRLAAKLDHSTAAEA